jgi:4-hydroxy-2-oxoglutarate aldolase
MSTLSVAQLGGLMVPATSSFTASGEIDSAAFQRNLDAHLSFGMDGVLVGGSSGESALLENDDRRQLLALARERVPQDKWLIAGIGSESTRLTIQRAIDAKDAGANAVLVISPHYFLKRMTEPALLAHFRAVADASPLPVLLYNMPAYSHIVLSPAFVHEMAQHDNVIGMKDSAGNIPVLQQYLEAQNDGFKVLTGSGGSVVPALAAGASGAILAIALYAGPAVRTMVNLYRAGDRDAAALLQTTLAPLAMDIAGAMGPAGIKAAMDLVGLHGGPTRAPLLPVSADELEIIRTRLAGAGLL